MIFPPLVIFTYNRANFLSKVLSEVNKYYFAKVYIFSDGSENYDDINLCELVRERISLNNWNSLVEIKILETNIGLNNNIILGLNYVFSIEKYAIILEDDCLPNKSFFEYCSQMLMKYEFENQVMHINGFTAFNDESILNQYNYDYLFTRFSLPSWGWATWARAWKHFNTDFNTWENHKKLIFSNFQQQNYSTWSALINVKYRENRIWDVQWMLDILYNRGLVISPKHNLVENMGFDEDATTTKNVNVGNQQVRELTFPLKMPQSIQVFDFEKQFENQLSNFISTFVK
jgi:hypothetical protein